MPDERIAKYPLAKRDTSKLLVYNKGVLSEDVFSNLPEYIPGNALMVFNNTRVIQARLRFRKATGAQIEVFCLEPEEPADYQMIFQETSQCVWQCLVGNSNRWKEGTLLQTVKVDGKDVVLSVERVGRTDSVNLVRFSWNGGCSFAELLEAAGELPIPPYLNRSTEESDMQTYQTVYSKVKGSVAAPTAGLHFTPAVLEALKTSGVQLGEVTLHVGAGTFKPVKSELISDHEMHEEYIDAFIGFPTQDLMHTRIKDLDPLKKEHVVLLRTDRFPGYTLSALKIKARHSGFIPAKQAFRLLCKQLGIDGAFRVVIDLNIGIRLGTAIEILLVEVKIIY